MNKVAALWDQHKFFYFQTLEHKKKPLSKKKSHHKGKTHFDVRSHENRPNLFRMSR